MSGTHVKYLLIGGGLASSAAAGAIRAVDREGELWLVGQEINRPYHRPPLHGAYLSRAADHEALFTRPADWFGAHDVRLLTGRRASHLDAARAAVTLDDGREVSFDRLLIATGATPVRLVVPGAELPGVHALRTLGDADRLRTAIEQAKATGRRHDRGRGRACVVGAGLAGVELATTLTRLGLAVDLVTALPHPWGRFAGDGTGAFVTRVLRANGVTVRAGSPLARLDGDGRVQRVVVDGAEPFDADFVVAAMGVTPAKDLLRGTSIKAERAILVDDRCRTSVPNVFAAGDCAAILDPLFGKHRLVDHWDNALATGTIAGRNMAGADARHDGVSTFTARAFDVEMTGFGEPRLVDRRLTRGQPGAGDGFAEVGVAADGRVCQVLCVGPVPPAAQDLVATRATVTSREEQFKDPAVPFGALVG